MLVGSVVGVCLILAGILLAIALKTVQRRGLARRIASAAAFLLAVGCFAMAVLMIRGLNALAAREAPLPVMHVQPTPERVARGHEIARSFCAGCHTVEPNGEERADDATGGGGEMSGGRDLGKDIPIPIGHLISANLTPIGRVAQWSDGQLFRAIRNSVDADGRWLMVMSWTNASRLSDEDTQSLIAYIRSLPPAGAPTPHPADALNPLGAAMLGAGMLPPGHAVTNDTILAPMRGTNVAWGRYLLSYQDCNACHGADLHGGIEGQLAPIGPDLSLVSAWSLTEFIRTMRTGIDPGGHQVMEPMPWRALGKMSDDDLEALFWALSQLPPRTHQPEPETAP